MEEEYYIKELESYNPNANWWDYSCSEKYNLGYGNYSYQSYTMKKNSQNHNENVAIKLYKRGDYGYKDNAEGKEYVSVDKFIPRGTPVFVTMCLNIVTKEYVNRMFLKEGDARKFLFNTSIPLNQRKIKENISFAIVRTIY